MDLRPTVERVIESEVRDQIASSPWTQHDVGAPGMPANIVTGEDADSVALCVGTVAGLPCSPQPGAEAGGAGGARRRRRHPTAGGSSPPGAGGGCITLKRRVP